jgi:hypothetical protein
LNFNQIPIMPIVLRDYDDFNDSRGDDGLLRDVLGGMICDSDNRITTVKNRVGTPGETGKTRGTRK